MVTLTITGPTFFSPKDEASFFAWLQGIPGVSRVLGLGRDLEVTLHAENLSEDALREMLALHWRHQLPMRRLAMFRNAANEGWFAASDTYWHDAVFGASA